MADSNTIPRHDEACEWCGSLPGESHSVNCPDYEMDADDVQFCDRCGQSYVTECGCDAAEQAVR